MDSRLVLALFGATLAACEGDQVIGDRSGDTDEISADDGDDRPGDGDGDGDADGDDDGDPPPLPDDLPACDRGILRGENSCEVCCIVDGDILAWCESLDCTPCRDEGQEVEPGATASKGCNVCTCNRDGTISCTSNDCAIDCDANPSACSWRTDLATNVAYERGDGYAIYHGDFLGPWVNTPGGELYPTREQMMELYELLAAPDVRDFIRNNDGPCPAIDGYWSQLRSERPPVNVGGSISLTLYSADDSTAPVTYKRVLSGDCTVPALQPLSEFLDRIAQ